MQPKTVFPFIFSVSTIRTCLVLLLATAIPAWSLTPLTMFSALNTTKPGCPRTCGNLTVPYPFGVGLGAGCSRNDWYDIFCMTSFDPPKAFLPSTGDKMSNVMEVVDISETQIRLRNQVGYTCFNSTAQTSPRLSDFVSFALQDNEAPYSISGTANKLMVIGCQDVSNFAGYFGISTFGSADGGASCRTNCSSEAKNVIAGNCNGIGCCQATIPKGMRSFIITFGFDSNHTTTLPYNPCGYTFLGDSNSFQFHGALDLDDPAFVNRTSNNVPMVLDWVIANATCAQARQDPAAYACQGNTTCVDAVDSGIGGYRCSCLPGYQGNPYLALGCSDINECEDPSSSPCSMICTNTPGNYTCSCPSGYSGDGRKDGTRCKREFPVLRFALGVGFSALFILISITWMFLALRKRRIRKIKEKFFQQNGGLLLKQLILPHKQDNTEQVKIFTMEQLKVATNKFSDGRIVGRGGYGTVYKGILPNKQIVAIKRSKFVDESQIEQFVNELVILARIGHANVVRLIGCCLEVEVPLLVYEFISNGTLYDHIHSREDPSWYSWSNCLRIAAEAANALAYLHSIPIIHRDIKSTNILLDDSYTAKIADFGASRSVPLNHTHLSTVVQGTLGYLDPEYFFSSQLTEKSDVYSFGVVLTELLTRERPLFSERQTEEKNHNLAAYFAKSMQQESGFNILDSRVVAEASNEQLMLITKLVLRCLSVKGEDRPSMNEVAMELEKLRKQTWEMSAK